MTKTQEIERPTQGVAKALSDGRINYGSILQAMGINPAEPLFQAMLLICERYDLDPMLGHVEVLPRSKKPYVTRDGFLHIAHRTGHLDGMEIVEERETPTHWEAKVAVYRNDMNRPFTFIGRYPKAGSNKQYGREMAIKTAERSAMKRAFNVALPEGDDPTDRPTTDTSATVAEIEEMAAVQDWVAEHGEPEPFDADVVEVQPDVEGEMFPEDAA